jgi:hypothetical protein
MLTKPLVALLTAIMILHKAAECKKSGGRYRKQGLARNYVCVKNYKDAFRKCTNSD